MMINMKSLLILFLFTLFLTTSISHADDYVWGEEFKEGDVISAETFNQIFRRLEKLNRTPRDNDLVGTWSCTALWINPSYSSGLSQDTTNSWIYSLSGSQLTFTASSEETSFPTGYTFSTSSPNPFATRSNGQYGASGNYILFNNVIVMKGILDGNNFVSHTVDVVSDDRIIFTVNHIDWDGNDHDNISKVVICDSAIAVPAAPTEANAVNSQSHIAISWTDRSNDELGFKIYRRLSTENEPSIIAESVLASPYIDNTLTEGQQAYYSVTAYNDNGQSANSKVVSATLDSIKPSVSSHTPLNNQQLTGSSVSVSIIFSETILLRDMNAVNISGTRCSYYSGQWHQYTIYPASVFNTELNTLYCSGDTVTVTIDKDGVQDLSGNNLDQDYSFTFSIE